MVLNPIHFICKKSIKSSTYYFDQSKKTRIWTFLFTYAVHTFRLLLNKDQLAFLLKKSIIQNVPKCAIPLSSEVWKVGLKEDYEPKYEIASLILWFSVLLKLRKFWIKVVFHWSVQRGVGKKDLTRLLFFPSEEDQITIFVFFAPCYKAILSKCT